jgi:hypothetical protein
MQRARLEPLVTKTAKGSPSRACLGRLSNLSACRFVLFLVFVASAALALALATRIPDLPPILFWMAMISSAVALVLQVTFQEEGSPWRWILLAEILAWIMLQRLLLTIPGTLGTTVDPFESIGIVTYIRDNGWHPVFEANEASNPLQSDFPMAHFAGLMIANITGMDFTWVARWAFMVLTLPTPLLVYLIGARVLRSHRFGLLSALLFGSLFVYVDFHREFIKEGIAFVGLVTLVYVYVARMTTRDVGLSILGIVTILFITLAHHFTALNALIFMLAFAAVMATRRLRTDAAVDAPQSPGFSSPGVAHGGVTTSLAIVAVVVIFGYWAYLAGSPFQMMVEALKDLSLEARFASAQAAVAGGPPRLLSVGDAVLGFITGALALIGLVVAARRRDPVWSWLAVLVVLGVGFGVMTVVYTQFVVDIPGHTWGARFGTFGYLALIIPALYLWMVAGKRWPGFYGGMVLFCSIFVLWNAAHLPSDLYHVSDLQVRDEVRQNLTMEEIAVRWVDGEGTVRVDERANLAAAIWDSEGRTELVAALATAGGLAQQDFALAIVASNRPEGDLDRSDPTIGLIYDNGGRLIYRHF